MEFDRIVVIGLGYIGLPTAAVLASRKINVVGVDVDPKVVDTINSGKIHIVEPDLDMLVHAAVTEGFLKATLTPEAADAFLIAVPTPFGENNEPDLTYVESAARAIAPVLVPGNLVVLESTSPVGTTELVSKWMSDERPDLSFPHKHQEESDIRIAHCPERVLPGRILHEIIENNRIIGGLTSKCSDAALALYRTITNSELLSTNARTAEMCKLVENSFRDVNIAFANELSMICEDNEVNVWELIDLANHHPRVNILQPGTGVGGHCIAVDPWFIVSQAPQLSRMIRTARETNDQKPVFVADKLAETFHAGSFNSAICLGLSFKPDIDDLRESPAIRVVTQLAKKGIPVKVIEPNINDLPPELVALGIEWSSLESLEHESRGALVAILVAHQEFKDSIFDKSSSVLDFCGALR